MKLIDIDRIVKTKEDYLKALDHLIAVERCDGEGSLKIDYRDPSGAPKSRIVDWGIIRHTVLPAAKAAVLAHKEKLQAELMLYGVDDFEGRK